MNSNEKRLRDALAVFAKTELPTGADQTFSPGNLRKVLATAEIELTPTQFEAAAIAFRQTPFYGGNYTLDARRILKAAA